MSENIKITKDEYKNLSDEELMQRLRDGEQDIMDYLMDKYKNLVRKKAQSLFILGADSDDLIQEGMIGLFKAVRDYDSGRDASFYTFADLCIVRQMYTAVQASRRKKHMPLNTYISLHGISFADGADETSETELVNLINDVSQKNPEEMLIDKESTISLEQKIDAVLSTFERQVLELHLTGMNYQEIARVLGREEKSTDNALQRIKSKIKKILDDEK